MNKNIDTIFENNRYENGFKFDRQVANVFENMITRSVPGYENVITMSGILARNFVKDNSNCYDLGCSLGATALSLQKNICADNCQIFAIDNSSAMIERLEAILSINPTYKTPINPVLADINSIEFTNNAFTTINFTLQFISIKERYALLQKIYNSMKENSVLILSEKIKFDEDKQNQLFIDTYHQWKETNGYSKREIEHKREALENILIPETIQTHRDRLTEIGFRDFSIFFQCFNFVSMVAFK